MKKIRVLIADDSALSRGLLKEYLERDASIEVIAEARNGQEAVEMAFALTPHVITMDVQMPKMDGLAAIEVIMARRAIPILVVSSVADAKTAYDALLCGALDVISKPEYDSQEALALAAKVKLLAGVSVFTRRPQRVARHVLHEMAPVLPGAVPQLSSANFNRVFAIACSTGGPEALASVLSSLPADFASPIVIAQHIAQGFSQGMADWLNRLTPLTVRLAKAGEKLQAGTVYLAPSEQHLRVDSNAKLHLLEPKLGEIYHPSCDQLLASVAQSFRQRSVGMILTGMGKDGVVGMGEIYRHHGVTLAQDEASSLIYGMNRVAIESGVICDVLPLDAMAERMVSLVC